MSKSSGALAKRPQNSDGKAFIAAVSAAMRRAARQVAVENKRLGLPMIVEMPRKARASRVKD